MKMMAEKECRDVDFEVDPALEEVLRVLHRPAEDCSKRSESSTAPATDLVRAVASIKAIGITELLVADELDCPPSAVLFHVSEVLAYANVTVAWQALAVVPASVALPDLCKQGAAMDWLLMLPAGLQWIQLQPLCDSSETVELCWFDGLRVLSPSERSPPLTSSNLLGFPHGRLLSMPLPSSGVLRSHSLSTGSRTELFMLNQALLGGLLHGALRRLVNEAYSYSKSRKSAGKPICQHQAVALRLADLALNQEALSLYLQDRLCAKHRSMGFQPVNMDYVGDSAARISRDAVQIAGAHGYVSGLPFKRLFEQIRTLTSALQLWQDISQRESNEMDDLRRECNT